MTLIEPRKVVSREITNAIQANIKTNEAGQSIAPDLFILVLDPGRIRLIGDKAAFSERFSSVIAQAGLESGIEFIAKPRVKVISQPGIKPGQFGVIVKFGLQESEETRALKVNNGDVNQVPEFAFLILDGIRIYQLTQQVVNIGRRVDNHVVIEDMKVSRMHAQIRVIKGRYVIFDLASSGGTYVNGHRVSQAYLSPGDVISLAGVEMVYGQDAVHISGENEGSTQPLIPFPESEEK